MASQSPTTPAEENDTSATYYAFEQESFAERDGRKDKMETRFKKFARTLAEDAEDIAASEQFQEWMDTVAKFPNRSAKNNLLIRLQKPDAKYVLGYRQWQDRFDTHVKEGETGIYIWAPIIRPRCPMCGESALYHKRGYVECSHHTSPDVNPDEWARGLVGFKTATVFDVSQVAGDPVEELDTNARPGEVSHPGSLRDDFLDAADVLGIDVTIVSEEEASYPGYGVADPRTGDVTVTDRAPAATASTLVHEYAHSLIHSSDDLGDRKSAEVEAEAVAYVVCRHFGLDVSGSEAYVANWQDQDTDMIENRLTRIAQTGKKIVQAITEK